MDDRMETARRGARHVAEGLGRHARRAMACGQHRTAAVLRSDADDWRRIADELGGGEAVEATRLWAGMDTASKARMFELPNEESTALAVVFGFEVSA